MGGLCEGVLLAAGSSRRHGENNKLLADLGGQPMIHRIAATMLASDLDQVTVILGHEADQVTTALDGLDCRHVLTPDYRQGQSASVKTGLDHLDDETASMMVVLGDMPLIDPGVINALIRHHHLATDPAGSITFPEIGGRRGNPVIWGERLFPALKGITGDQGGRPLFQTRPEALNPLPLDDQSLLLDADTDEDLAIIRHHFHEKSRN